MSTTKYNLEDVYPKLGYHEIHEFLKDSDKIDTYQIDQNIELAQVPKNLEKLLSQVYISKKLKNRAAIKARYHQYLELNKIDHPFNITASDVQIGKLNIDLIMEDDKTGEVAWVFISEYLDKKQILNIKNQITIIFENPDEFTGSDEKIKELLDLDFIYLVCGKMDRKVINDLGALEIPSEKVPVSCFLEYLDPNRPFDDDETIIVDDLKLSGFNFGSIDDILSIIKEKKGKGKYTIYALDSNGFQRNIWEGLIFPKKILNHKGGKN
jgi:hypothetical protein